MRTLLSISLLLVASTTALAAQSIDPAGNSNSLAPIHPKKSNTGPSLDPAAQAMKNLTVLQAIATNSSCPFPISAKHGSGGGLVAVRSGQPGQPNDMQRPVISQSIHLTVTDSRAVATASVLVHGTTAAARMMPIGGSGEGPSQISRPLQVTFSTDGPVQDGRNQENADLLLRGFTSVSSIDVESVTYADGTTWRSKAGACRVVPDGMMLIGAR